jgi:hypothetical protein
LTVAIAVALAGFGGLGSAEAMSVIAPHAEAMQPTASTETTAPADQFGACIAGGGSADVLLLIDESGSLRQSDTALARVTSATYLVNELASYASQGGLKMDIKVSAFAQNYESVLGWTNLDAGSLPTVRASISSLANRNHGEETDYWSALNHARGDLATKAATRSTTSCQAVVWFTDGKLSYSVRRTKAQQVEFGTEKVFAPGVQLTTAAGAAAVTQRAKQDLCRDGGVADQLRASKIWLFGVGLDGNTSQASDFDLIQSIVTGRSSSSTCGKLIDPAPGEFFLATDIDSMLFAFDTIGSAGTRAIAQEQGICQVVVCADQSHDFVLDSSTPDVRILASADVDGLQASIRMPNGALVSLPNTGVGTSTTVDPHGTLLSFTWESSKTVSIVMSKGTADRAWSGEWQLAFTDPTGGSSGKHSRSNIHISGSLAPAWTNKPTPLRAGAVLKGATFGLVGRDGKTVDASALLGTVKYSAILQDGTGHEVTLFDSTDKAAVGTPVSVDLRHIALGAGIVTMRLSITTAAATNTRGKHIPGTTLEPVTVSVPVTVLAPLSYPTVSSSIDFGQATGAVSLNGTVTVSGSGCVWIPADARPKILASPSGLGKLAISPHGRDSRAHCFTAGSAHTLPLTLTTEHPGNGSINGTISVMIAPAGATGRPLHVTVLFTASLQKPLNATNFWATLLTALILGPGIPLLVLYLAKWLVSRIPARALTGAVIDVVVEGASVLREGRPFTIGAADLRRTVAIDASGSRRLTIEGVDLQTHIGASPGGAGYVTVSAPGRTTASSTSPSTDRTGVRARLPLAIHNHWVVLHTIGAAANAAAVLVLPAGDSSVAQKTEIENDINRRLPGILRDLLEAEEKANPGSTAPESGDQGAGSFFTSASAAVPAQTGAGAFTGWGRPDSGTSSSVPAVDVPDGPTPPQPNTTGSSNPWDIT